MDVNCLTNVPQTNWYRNVSVHQAEEEYYLTTKETPVDGSRSSQKKDPS